MVPNGPVAIVSADFNNDGIPDLAVASQLANSVSILIGTGLGTFDSSKSSTVPNVSQPRAMAVVYFKNDTFPHLATVSAANGSVIILTNNHSGRFSAGAPIPSPDGMNPSAMIAANFNPAGTNTNPAMPYDLAIAYFDTGRVAFLFGTAAGNFAPPVPSAPYPIPNTPPNINPAHPMGLAAADFNSDGLTDLAVTNQTDNSLTVLLNSQAGFYRTPASPVRLNPDPTAMVIPSAIVSADFNGDYIPDLAVANTGSNTVSILTGNGTGAFTLSSTILNVGTNPVALAAADLNGDTFADLIVANYSSNSVSVYLQVNPPPPSPDSSPMFTLASQSPYPTGSGPRALTIADLNGDGRLDIVTANYMGSDVSVLLNNIPVLPAMVSAASYTPAIAPCSIVTIYGIGLASTTPPPPQLSSPPVPQTTGCIPPSDFIAAGTSVSITDSTGARNMLALLYVSPAQINAIVPSGVATGPGTFTVTTVTGSETAAVTIASAAPEIFTANATGKGVAAAQYIQSLFASGSSGSLTNVYTCSAGMPPPNTCSPKPIDASSGAAVLVLYGTGIRNRASLSSVTVTVDGQPLTPSYAGLAPASWGEDQINVPLPASLAHTGLVNVSVTIGAAISNVVTLYFL